MSRGVAGRVKDPDIQPIQHQGVVPVDEHAGAVFPLHPHEEEFSVPLLNAT